MERLGFARRQRREERDRFAAEVEPRLKMESFDQVVTRLQLQPIEREGGWFRRIFTGSLDLNGRPAVTCIYALFTVDTFSAMHRLDADEQFLFLEGDPMELFEIRPGGTSSRALLGSGRGDGEARHWSFAKGTWFGGRTVSGGNCGWTLLAAVVSPGFVWSGFELGDRAMLKSSYPQHSGWIEQLTRG